MAMHTERCLPATVHCHVLAVGVPEVLVLGRVRLLGK